jgi:surface protein
LEIFSSLSHTVFREATAFNQDISTWNTGSVQHMQYSTYLSFFSISFSFNILNNVFLEIFFFVTHSVLSGDRI